MVTGVWDTRWYTIFGKLDAARGTLSLAAHVPDCYCMLRCARARLPPLRATWWYWAPRPPPHDSMAIYPPSAQEHAHSTAARQHGGSGALGRPSHVAIDARWARLGAMTVQSEAWGLCGLRAMFRHAAISPRRRLLANPNGNWVALYIDPSTRSNKHWISSVFRPLLVELHLSAPAHRGACAVLPLPLRAVVAPSPNRLLADLRLVLLARDP